MLTHKSKKAALMKAKERTEGMPNRGYFDPERMGQIICVRPPGRGEGGEGGIQGEGVRPPGRRLRP